MKVAFDREYRMFAGLGNNLWHGGGIEPVTATVPKFSLLPVAASSFRMWCYSTRADFPDRVCFG